jgi:hypothetical protein
LKTARISPDAKPLRHAMKLTKTTLITEITDDLTAEYRKK